MYGFVDTTARSVQSASLSLRTIFNNTDLDNALSDDNGSFRTLSISGRGILPRRIRVTDTPARHGVREGKYTYDAREITVKYKLTDRTNEGFRERFNNLNGLLLGSKRRLEFTDEDAHFIATLSSGDTPEEDSNNIVGTLVFLCSDPAKFKRGQTLNVTNILSSFMIGGQAETPWISETVFNVPQSEFVIENNEGGKIALSYNFTAGDRLIIDCEFGKVMLNGESLMVALSLASHWFPMKPGFTYLRASHPSELKYVERYY